MKKKLLLDIPIEQVENKWTNPAKRIKKEEYLVSAKEIQVNENKILLMYFYHLSDLREENTKVAFRVFLSKNNYITQDLENAKWKTGCIENLIGHYWNGWYNECVLVDDKSSESIRQFLNIQDIEKDPLKEIDNFQKGIMAKRLHKKHQKIKDRIDKQMESVPKLPRGFKKWIDETALFHSRYIYYVYKSRKKLDGYCTHCKSDVIVESPRHNKKGICPKCKSPITYKATGKSKRISDKGQASIVQKTEDGIIVRYFSIRKDYNNHYRNPSLLYCELSRDFYDKDGNMKSFEWSNFKQTGEIRWCDGLGKFAFNKAILYEKNLEESLKDTIWEHSAIKEFATHEKGFGFPTHVYLERYKKYPSIEYLVKLKLYKLANESISHWFYWQFKENINLAGKNLEEVLNINKSELAIAQRINAGTRELDIIRKAYKANLKLDDEQILYISRNLEIKKVIKISKYTTVHKMIKYIKSQVTADRYIKDTFSDWVDYIKFCNILKYNLKNKFILFPKNLKESHDDAYKLVQEHKNELFNEEIKKMSNKLNELFNWQYKDYLIISPKSADEIIREGQILRHCVGTYVEKVVTEESIILFLRKKENPEQPYFTIEVNPSYKEIKQCRGSNNKSMSTDKEIKKVIEKYEKEKLKSIIYDEAS